MQIVGFCASQDRGRLGLSAVSRSVSEILQGNLVISAGNTPRKHVEFEGEHHLFVLENDCSHFDTYNGPRADVERSQLIRYGTHCPFSRIGRKADLHVAFTQ
jgi:hypothetical protein